MPELTDRKGADIFGNVWTCGQRHVLLCQLLFLALFLGTAVLASAQPADPDPELSPPTLSLLPKEQTVSQNHRQVSVTILLSPAPSTTATVTVAITGEDGSTLTITVLLPPGRAAEPVQFFTEPSDIGRLLVTATAVTGGASEPEPATATVIVKEQQLVRLVPEMPVVVVGSDVRLIAEISSTPTETVTVLILATRASDGLLAEGSVEFSSSVRVTDIMFSGSLSLPQGDWTFTASIIPVDTVDPIVDPVSVRVRGTALVLFLLERNQNTVVPLGEALLMDVLLAERDEFGRSRSGGITFPVTVTFTVDVFVVPVTFIRSIGSPAEGLLLGSYEVNVPPGQGSGQFAIPADIVESGQIRFAIGPEVCFSGDICNSIVTADGQDLPVSFSAIQLLPHPSVRPDIRMLYGYTSVFTFSHLVSIPSPVPSPLCPSPLIAAVLPGPQIFTGKPLQMRILARCAPITTVTVTVTAVGPDTMSIEKDFHIPPSIFGVTGVFADSLSPGMWAFTMVVRNEDGSTRPGVLTPLSGQLRVIKADIVLRTTGTGPLPLDQPVQVGALLADASGSSATLTSTLDLDLEARMQGASSASVSVTHRLTISGGESIARGSLNFPAAGVWSISVQNIFGDAADDVPSPLNIVPLEVEVGPRLQLMPIAKTLPFNSTLRLHVAASIAPHVPVAVTVVGQSMATNADPLAPTPVGNGQSTSTVNSNALTVLETVQRIVTLSPLVSSAAISLAPSTLMPGLWIFSMTADPDSAVYQDIRFNSARIEVRETRIRLRSPLAITTSLIVGQDALVTISYEQPVSLVQLLIFRSLNNAMPEQMGRIELQDAAENPSGTITFAVPSGEAGKYVYTLRELAGKNEVINEDAFSATVRIVARIVLAQIGQGSVHLGPDGMARVSVSGTLVDINGEMTSLTETLALSLQAETSGRSCSALLPPQHCRVPLFIFAGESIRNVPFPLPAADTWQISVRAIGRDPRFPDASGLVIPKEEVLPLEVTVGPSLDLQPRADVLPTSSSAVLKVIASSPLHTTVSVTVHAQMVGGTAEPITQLTLLLPSVSSSDVEFRPNTFLPGRWIFSATAEPAGALDTRFAMAEITVFDAPIRIEEPLTRSLKVSVGQSARAHAVFQAPPVPFLLNIFRARDGGMPEIHEILVVPAPAGEPSTVVVSFGTGRLARASEYIYTLREPAGQDVVENEGDYRVLVRAIANIQLTRTMAGVLRNTEFAVQATLLDVNNESTFLASTAILTLQATASINSGLPAALPVTGSLHILPGRVFSFASLALPPGDWTVSVTEVSPAAAANLVIPPDQVQSLPVLVRAPRVLPVLTLRLQTAGTIVAGTSSVLLTVISESTPDAVVTVEVTALRISGRAMETKIVVMLLPTGPAETNVIFEPDALAPGRWTFEMQVEPVNVLRVSSATVEISVLEAAIRLVSPLAITALVAVGQSTEVRVAYERPSLPFPLLFSRSRNGRAERQGEITLSDAALIGSAPIRTGVFTEAGEYVYTLREPAGQDVVENEDDFQATVRVAANAVLRRLTADMVRVNQPVQLAVGLTGAESNPTTLPVPVAMTLRAVIHESTETATVLPVTSALTISPGDSTGSASLSLSFAGTWIISVTDIGPAAAGFIISAGQIVPLEIEVGPTLHLQPRNDVLLASSTAVLRVTASFAPPTTVSVMVRARMADGAVEPIMQTTLLSPSVSLTEVSFGPNTLLPGRWIFSATAEPAGLLGTRAAVAEITVFDTPIRIEEPLAQSLEILVAESIEVNAIFQAPPVPVILNVFRTFEGGMPEARSPLVISGSVTGLSTAAVSFGTGVLAEPGLYAFALQEPAGQDVVANEDAFSVRVRARANAVLRRGAAGLLLVDQPVPVEAVLLDAAGDPIVLPATVTMTLRAVINASAETAAVLPVTSALTISPGDSTGSASLSLSFAGTWIISVTDIGPAAASFIISAGQIVPLEIEVGPTLHLQPRNDVLLASSTAVLRVTASFAPPTTVSVMVRARMADGAVEPIMQTTLLSPSVSLTEVSFGPNTLLPGRWIFSATAEPAGLLGTRAAVAEITVFDTPIRIEEPLAQSLEILVAESIEINAIFQAPPVPVILNVFRTFEGGMPEARSPLVISSAAEASTTIVVNFITGVLAEPGLYAFALQEPAGQDVVANEDAFSVRVRARANAVLRRGAAGLLLVDQPVPVEAVLLDAAGDPIVLPATVTMTLRAVINASAETAAVLPVTSALTISPGDTTGTAHLSLPFPGEWIVSVTGIEPVAAEVLVVPAERIRRLPVNVDIGLNLTVRPVQAFPGEQVAINAELMQVFNTPVTLEVAVHAPTAVRESVRVPVQPGARRGSATFVPDAESGTWRLVVMRSSALFIGAAEAELEVLPVNLPGLADPFAEINADDLVLALRYLVLCAEVRGPGVQSSDCVNPRSGLHMNLDAAGYNLSFLAGLTLPDLTGDSAGGTDDVLLLLEALNGVSPELLFSADLPERSVRLRILSQLLKQAE